MGLFSVLFTWHLWFGSGRKMIVLRTCLHFVCFGKLYCQYLRYFELLLSFTSYFIFSFTLMPYVHLQYTCHSHFVLDPRRGGVIISVNYCNISKRIIYVACFLLCIISEIFYSVISTWYEFGIVGLCFSTNFAGGLMAFLLLDLELRLPGPECSTG